jgi:hypothetical protein
MADETIMQRLAKAFPAEVVKTKPGRGGSKPLSYISHALVTERLNEVDPDWSWRVLTEHIWYDPNGAPHCAGVTVEMTVGGVTRVEAGGPQRQEAFTNEIKNAYSDAIKRAAMRFGVALYIWDSLVDAQDDDDAQEEHEAITPRQRAAVDEQHQRNTTPPPMSLPATRTRQEPNGPDVQRQKLIEAAAAKDVVLDPAKDASAWADDLDRIFEVLDSDFRVDRIGNTVTAKALFNAILAIPAKVTA